LMTLLPKGPCKSRGL